MNHIPEGYKYCNGINGTPDLRGRVIIGTGPFDDSYGHAEYNLGDIGGERYHQLSILEMPIHSHATQITFSAFNGTSIIPGYVAGLDTYTAGAYRTNFAYNNTSSSGGNLAHNILQPYISIHWIIKT